MEIKKPLSSTLGGNPRVKTKGESRIKRPYFIAFHGNDAIINTFFKQVSTGIKGWCPVKDSNLQLSVSKTAASTNFANWTKYFWGEGENRTLADRFTGCRATTTLPTP